MRLRAIIFGLLVALHALAYAPGPAAAEPPTVQAVRLGAHGDSTRVVVELTEEAAPRVATLARPGRILLSLPDLRFAPRLARAGAHGLVRAVHYRFPRSGEAQIVLDTKCPVQIANMFTLPPGSGQPNYRLVLDLAPHGAKADASLRAHANAPPPILPRPLPAPNLAATASAGPKRGSPPSMLRLAPSRTSARPGGRAPRGPEAPWESAEQGSHSLRPILVTDLGGAAQALRRSIQSDASLPPGRKRPVVVIDAGHGGADPGAVGPQGEFEKTIVFAVAQALRHELEGTGRFDVVLTRSSDVFIPLGERVAIARRARADLFLSIHADTIGDVGMRGAGVYTLSAEASDRQAEALAAKENRSDLIAGVDLKNQSDEVTSILIDFAQHDTQAHSMRFAELLVPRIRDAIPVRQRTHRSAGFRVLKAVDVPSALVELGYLSNPADEHVLMSPDGRAELARALMRAIQAYFGAES